MGGRRAGRLLGEDEALPELPEEVVFSDEDIDRASALWDEVMGDAGVAGLLEAEVEEGDAETQGEGENGRMAGMDGLDRGGKREDGEGTGWVWEARAKRYRNRETGRFVGQEELRRLRDEYVDRLTERSDRLSERLFADEISVQRWTREMRELVKDAFAGQYMAARGGRNAMTQSDWGRVGRMVRDQYAWLQGFAEDLQAGKLTEGQARARAGLYMAASTQAFERGKQTSYGMPALPQYPGDGNTECRVNCKCHWQIRELKDRWEATWAMSLLAEHCDDCIVNAATWAPLVFMKEGG